MIRTNRPDTREEILAAASRRFAVTGFKGTSLHDIATEVGCSKATLLYHFQSKDAILAELLAPAVAALAELDGRLAALDPAARQQVAIDGFVALSVRFRREISVLGGDLPELLERPVFAQVREMTDRLLGALSGAGAQPSARLAALLVLGGVPAACVETVDVSDPELRNHLCHLAARTLGLPPD